MTGGLAFALQVIITDEFNTAILSGTDAPSLVSYGLSAEYNNNRVCKSIKSVGY